MKKQLIINLVKKANFMDWILAVVVLVMLIAATIIHFENMNAPGSQLQVTPSLSSE